MPKVTIDNKVYEFEGRPKLLQFCMEHGIEIPYFCYHSAMSVPANCRQCLVKVGNPQVDRATREPVLDDDGNPVIQYFPKLQTSCSMDMTDGLVVHTHRTDELVARAQRDNLEFLLANHPLDCPICDQAGNCPLQNQAYKYGPEGSRFEFDKVHKPKKIELGPRVMLDGERCINCTRCVRFTSEISKSNQLTIIERGVKNYPLTPPGVVFDEPYSMNVIDICPVGALTSKDFRFRARAWEMSKTPSIVTGTSRGSNCYYWVKDNEVMRITARTNVEVNGYWLADVDRLNYRKFNDARPLGPDMVSEGARVSTDWDGAYERAATLLRGVSGDEVLFIGSAHASVEDNYLLMKLADHVGASAPVYIPHVEAGSGDDWLVTDDKAENAQGCERLGMHPVDETVVRARLDSGAIKLVYVMDEDPVASGLFTADQLKSVDVVLHYYNTTNETFPVANVSLPAATIVETIGTFVNDQGHAQRVRPVKAIQSMNRSLMMETGLSRQDRHATPFDKWSKAENKVNCQPGWVTIPEIASRLNLDLNYKSPKAIMAEIESSNPAFSGATYDAMGLTGARLAEVGTTV
ncbi:MAG: 2Fe-2S iron-sulfur cluster binding domain-containing protein [Bacteroidetes bacterium]|nr:2Fe-2S iron-sulfur cluster binding domain-containing protein [Bacteroidota bacterium]